MNDSNFKSKTKIKVELDENERNRLEKLNSGIINSKISKSKKDLISLHNNLKIKLINTKSIENWIVLENSIDNIKICDRTILVNDKRENSVSFKEITISDYEHSIPTFTVSTLYLRRKGKLTYILREKPPFENLSFDYDKFENMIRIEFVPMNPNKILAITNFFISLFKPINQKKTSGMLGKDEK